MPTRYLTTYTKWGIAAGIALFSIFLFYLNSLYPYFPGDDCVFQLIIPDEGIIGTERVDSLGDLVESQYNFYFNYHYRVLNHFVLQGLLALPPIVFDFLNVIAFLLLPWCLLKFSEHKDDLQYWLKYFFLLMFIWVFHINLGWAYFPATGALNYTWYLIPQLLYLALLLKLIDGQEVSSKWLVVLAAINALGNENACIMLCMLTAITIYLTRKRPARDLYLSILLFIAGGVFMLASPSIAKRLEVDAHMTAGLVPHLIEFSKRTVYYCIRYLPLLLLLLLSPERKPINTRKSILLLVAFVTATLSMVLAPLFEPRSAVLGFFVLLALMVSLVDSEWKLWPIYVITFVAIVLCFTRLPEFKKQYHRHQVNEQILESNRGATDRVHLERYCDYSTRDYLLCHENSENPNSFDNKSVAALYNIKEIALSEKFVQSKRRQQIFTQLSADSRDLDNFVKIKKTDDFSFYHQKNNAGMDLLLETTKDFTEPFYILRGAPKGVNKYRLLLLMPQSIRLYFLDYMEGNTLRKQDVLQSNGKSYNYFFIPDHQRYQYCLVSRYSFETHSPTGDIFQLNLDLKKD